MQRGVSARMLFGRHTSENRLRLRYLCTGQTPKCCSQSHTAAEPRQLRRPFDLGIGSASWPAVAWEQHMCLCQLECLHTDKPLATFKEMEWNLWYNLKILGGYADTNCASYVLLGSWCANRKFTVHEQGKDRLPVGSESGTTRGSRVRVVCTEACDCACEETHVPATYEDLYPLRSDQRYRLHT